MEMQKRLMLLGSYGRGNIGDDAFLIAEAIKQALVEIELCSDISQGVEDDLQMALELLEDYNDKDSRRDKKYYKNS